MVNPQRPPHLGHRPVLLVICRFLFVKDMVNAASSGRCRPLWYLKSVVRLGLEGSNVVGGKDAVSPPPPPVERRCIPKDRGEPPFPPRSGRRGSCLPRRGNLARPRIRANSGPSAVVAVGRPQRMRAPCLLQFRRKVAPRRTMSRSSPPVPAPKVGKPLNAASILDLSTIFAFWSPCERFSALSSPAQEGIPRCT